MKTKPNNGKNLVTSSKNAFTLAEVLITLGVIGVVAAMTLPTLIQKIQDKITVAKVEKAYNILSNAYLRAIQENGGLSWSEGWDCSAFEQDHSMTKNARCYMSYIAKHISHIKTCDVSWNNTCNKGFTIFEDSSSGRYYNIKGEELGALGAWGGSYTYSVDGLEFMGNGNGSYIIVKTDRNKKNVLNKNIFHFQLGKNKLHIGNHNTRIDNYLEGNIQGVKQLATYWVIMHKNLDYLHCPEKLSNKGPFSCK